MNIKKIISFVLVIGMSISLLVGCKEKESEKETISVYLWSNSMYEKYAPYIQSQLKDVNVEFVVGNNDLDFYKFLNENGGLPDIITCCRFSIHDASPLKDSLMDLSTTNVAGAVYNTYLNNFMNEDGSVNWLPMSADAHGFVVNKSLFEKYDIALPTDYESFVEACQKFSEVGIRGFSADYMYDYTCMETLQGLSASELSTTAGRQWRTKYSDPGYTGKIALDEQVWPYAFERMEQFIKDTGLNASDLNQNYDSIADMYSSGELAMYFGSSMGVKMYQDQGIDTTFMPFYQENGEEWLMTTPYFQVALNKNLEKSKTRRDAAIKVLNTMLSADAQNIVCANQDTLSYSQDVPLRFTDYLKDVRDVVEENHMYIRIASNDFFRISKDVVSKMISGEYDATQAYSAFNAQLQEDKDTAEPIALKSKTAYSNSFNADGGNEAYSVMANTLRDVYKSDILVATANSFTGNVLKADYTEKMVGNMIMPNDLQAYQKKMSGEELTLLVASFVEGVEDGFVPFNLGSLPVLSGIEAEVKEVDGKYKLESLTKDGKRIGKNDEFTVTCLAIEKDMTPLMDGFKKEEQGVKDTWVDYILNGGVLSKPEKYIRVRG